MKVCLNGGRGRADHPGVPVTPAELAASAAAAVAAGAEAVHLHPRRADGAESLEAADVAAAVTAVRRACPAAPLGVSTGLWIAGGDVAARRSAVAAWADLPAAARPDFASVNLSEPGWTELCDVLRSAGVATEAGIWSVADADRMAAAGQSISWLRILVEIINAPAGNAVGVADEVLSRLDELHVTAPRLLHGEQASCWPLIAHAGTLGLPTRIGLEDTTTGPAGSAVTSNAELVQLALSLWTETAGPKAAC
ncbi:MAG TPA: 3-keto-5-aminohexanoate cleavage protein [Streptosporangiaceae bacterium]|nr:3-keto-5-aminohexanoate cleavage protein [Streptosporangiaceae bacterium]